MSVFSFLRRKKNVDDSKPKPVKVKTFKFSTSEACCVGDRYEYTVTADSQEEAFKSLVEFFYGKNMCQPVESYSCTISYPGLGRFTYNGMPMWFAKLISGDHGPEGCYRGALEKYARLHGIELK